MSLYEIPLDGCTPEPLINYLKALGILRLVAEQKDPRAGGCWRDGVFVLRSSLDRDAIAHFLLTEYAPTPIVVPWSGGDFFRVNPSGNVGPYKQTPTATAVIEAFLASRNDRLRNYRETILTVLATLDACGISDKKGMEDKKAKSRFLSCLRSRVDDQVVEWVDACAVMSDEKASFSALLGSGGGSDGNTHFSDNFMQNLWEALPDFGTQRKGAAVPSERLLDAALFGTAETGLISKRTSSLYDAGAVGGPNAGQGFERTSFGNPWSIVLCLEGTLLLAGSMVRRHGTAGGLRAAFPFQVRLSPTRSDSATSKESAGREIWLPLWTAWTSKAEVSALFSEGRASATMDQVENGVDFARAVAGLGIDRGIQAFQRFAIVRGRVGGDNYNTAAVLGHVEVRARNDVDLLSQADGWVEWFRRAAAGDKVPPRFERALRIIESTIYEYCQYGDPNRFGQILVALGKAERELATAEKFREEKFLKPLAGLSPDWIRAAYGHSDSAEFEIALALSGVWDRNRKLGPLRSNLEPVNVYTDKSGGTFASWLDKDRAVVWNSADLCTNMISVLERRIMDAERKGCESLPLSFCNSVSVDAVAKFIVGGLDEQLLEELLWGFLLVDQSRQCPSIAEHTREDVSGLPRAYALMKLTFLPQPIETRSGPVVVWPEVEMLRLLRVGYVGKACALACRRLRAAGLVPMPFRSGKRIVRDREWDEVAGSIDPKRMAAALLLPVSSHSVNTRIAPLVLRQGEQSKTIGQL